MFKSILLSSLYIFAFKGLKDYLVIPFIFIFVALLYLEEYAQCKKIAKYEAALLSVNQ